MQKILTFMLFLGLALNINICTIKANDEKSKNEKAHLSKMDYAKITAALVSTVWFSFAALTSPLSVRDNDVLPDFAYSPLLSLFIPMAIIGKILFKCEDSDENINSFLTLAGITSVALASESGRYVYKKIYELRRMQHDQQQDINKS